MWNLLTRLKRIRLKRRGVTPLELPPGEGYRRWAADYGDEPNAFQQLEAPVLERLLPDLRGQAVLDLGCGKGRIARLALERGASRVMAADLSLAMLSDRRNFRAARGAPARLACALPALPLRPRSFDTVVCALVLGHVAELTDAVAAMAGVLRPGGFLVCSDFHPSATLKGWRRTFVDPESGETCAVRQHLHLFGDYVTAFRKTGLRLEALEEPCWRGFPVAFVLQARKEGGPCG